MNIDLRLGDCLEVLKTIPDNSIDAVVTDPPYGLEFMGKKWDYDVPSVEVWTECLRVLKPGGHLLSFAGSRTYHRMAVRIEDSGFEIRDQIMYIYGSGFPKSHNIRKALDKIIDEKERTEQNTEHNLRCVPDSNLQETELIGKKQNQMLFSQMPNDNLERTLQKNEFGEKSKERTQIGEERSVERRNNSQETKGELQGSQIHKMSEGIFGDGEKGRICDGTQNSNGQTSSTNIDENGSSPSHRPQSIKQQNRKSNVISEQLTSQEIREIRERFDGYGTALKPAHEPIVMARKPLSEKSIAENVLKHGTGGINIDGSRIEMKDKENINFDRPRVRESVNPNWILKQAHDYTDPQYKEYNEQGRFPANIIFDEEAGQLLDEQSGNRKSGKMKTSHKRHTDGSPNGIYGKFNPNHPIAETYGDEGGASRFFYCPKASKKDRNEGLVVEKEKNKRPIGVAFNSEENLFTQGKGNHHPTVKPTDLMRYLINLITPPNGVVLDPFMGSGSTGKAAVRCGLNFIGIEKEQEYMDIAKARIEHERNKPVQTKLF